MEIIFGYHNNLYATNTITHKTFDFKDAHFLALDASSIGEPEAYTKMVHKDDPLSSLPLWISTNALIHIIFLIDFEKVISVRQIFAHAHNNLLSLTLCPTNNNR